MEYQTRTYFNENEEEDVKGFTIIDTNKKSNEYHIAEKWTSEETWLDYHIPEEQLLARVSDGKCEVKAHLSDEQYKAVCDKIQHEKVSATQIEA